MRIAKFKAAGLGKIRKYGVTDPLIIGIIKLGKSAKNIMTQTKVFKFLKIK